MSTITNNRHQALSDNVWLHFFQMGHFSSTNARPTILVRGEGSRVWDQDGNEYIDGLSGLFTVNVGYGRREIIEAISAQLSDIAYVSPFSFPVFRSLICLPVWQRSALPAHGHECS